MHIDRRGVVIGAAALAASPAAAQERPAMYGLIGKMTVAPGRRDEIIAILLEQESMPGCLSYVVARDPQDADAIWITEVWTDQGAHQASLSLPSVKDAIARARPHITGFSDRHELEPVGGIGINT